MPSLPWVGREQLTASHDLAGFHCGDPVMDAWLQGTARQAHGRGACTVWCCTDASGKLNGFFALSSHTVEAVDIVRNDQGGMSGVIPAILLGQIGLAKELRGDGKGAYLMLEAFHQAYNASLLVGSRLLVLDAANDKLVDYYRGLGFKSMPSNANRMYIKISSIKKALLQEGILLPDASP